MQWAYRVFNWPKGDKLATLVYEEEWKEEERKTTFVETTQSH